MDSLLPKDPREDNAEFLGYGLVDVSLGWFLRYGHFPTEIINLGPLGNSLEILVQQLYFRATAAKHSEAR
jgi:hypothetical protein